MGTDGISHVTPTASMSAEPFADATIDEGNANGVAISASKDRFSLGGREKVAPLGTHFVMNMDRAQIFAGLTMDAGAKKDDGGILGTAEVNLGGRIKSPASDKVAIYGELGSSIEVGRVKYDPYNTGVAREVNPIRASAGAGIVYKPADRLAIVLGAEGRAANLPMTTKETPFAQRELDLGKTTGAWSANGVIGLHYALNEDRTLTLGATYGRDFNETTETTVGHVSTMSLNAGYKITENLEVNVAVTRNDLLGTGNDKTGFTVSAGYFFGM